MIVPGAPVSTLISTVTFAPLAIVPSAQMTVLPERTQLPWVGVADTKVTPAGSVSLSDTLGALAGPVVVNGEGVGELLARQHRVGRVGLGQRQVGDRVDGGGRARGVVDQDRVGGASRTRSPGS